MSRALLFVLCCAIASYADSTDRPHPRWAVAVLPSGHEFALEVAADDLSRARGYGGRARIGPREGMIFVFDRDDRHSFWMKDCKLAIDILWLDVNGRIVWVAVKQQPCPPSGECPSILPPSPARYVLEFAGGTAAAESLRPGDIVVVLSDPPLR